MDFEKLLKKLEMKSDTVLNKSLKEAGKIVLKRSNELVPVDTGALRASGRVDEKSKKTIMVRYPIHYAVYVENDLEIQHPIHGDRDCGGKAKFLFTAVEENKKKIIKKIAGDIL